MYVAWRKASLSVHFVTISLLLFCSPLRAPSIRLLIPVLCYDDSLIFLPRIPSTPDYVLFDDLHFLYLQILFLLLRLSYGLVCFLADQVYHRVTLSYLAGLLLNYRIGPAVYRQGCAN